MAYYAFDLLYLDGFDLRAAPFMERKRVLEGLLEEAGDIGPVFLSDHFEEDAATLFDKSCEMGSKALYRSCATRRTNRAAPRAGSR